jgi:hypothetical protein
LPRLSLPPFPVLRRPSAAPGCVAAASTAAMPTGTEERETPCCSKSSSSSWVVGVFAEARQAGEARRKDAFLVGSRTRGSWLCTLQHVRGAGPRHNGRKNELVTQWVQGPGLEWVRAGRNLSARGGAGPGGAGAGRVGAAHGVCAGGECWFGPDQFAEFLPRRTNSEISLCALWGNFEAML